MQHNLLYKYWHPRAVASSYFIVHLHTSIRCYLPPSRKRVFFLKVDGLEIFPVVSEIPRARDKHVILSVAKDLEKHSRFP